MAFMILAGFSFFFGNNHQRSRRCGPWLLYSVKLVGAAADALCIDFDENPYSFIVHTLSLSHTHTHTHTHTKKIFLLVPMITAACDLIFTIAKGRADAVAQFQYVTPVVIISSIVSQAIICIIINFFMTKI